MEQVVRGTFVPRVNATVALDAVLLARRVRVWVLACLVAMFGAAGSAWAQGLPIEVPIRIVQPQSVGVVTPLKAGRRLALLLIDRSGSMTFTDDQRLSRWEELLASLRPAIAELAKVSPGIELEVRFFDNELDCTSPIRKILETPADADAVFLLIKQLGPPRTVNKPRRGGTALHASVHAVATQLLERVADFEWTLFALYSDGEDADSPPQFRPNGIKDWQRAVAALVAKWGPAKGQAVAIPVGPEGRNMLKQGVFKAFVPGALGGLLPAPPPPACRVSAEFNPPFNGVAPIGPLLKRGDVVAVRVNSTVVPGDRAGACVPDRMLMELEYGIRLAPNSSFRLVGADVVPGTGAEVRFELAGDGDEGVTMRFELLPRARGGSDMVVLDRPLSITAAFRPAKSPPNPESWRLSVPQFVAVGQTATLTVENLGPDFDLEWRFGGGAAPVAKGASCAASFAKAGRVEGVLFATSSDGKSGQRPFAFEVIDSSFDIVATGKIVRGKPIALSVKPRGPSECTYRWEIEGRRLEGPSVSFTPVALGEIDVRCTAVSVRGALEFVDTERLLVADEPKLVIAQPDALREGSGALSVVCYLADVEGSPNVTLKLDGREVASKQPKPSDGILQVEFEIALTIDDWRRFGPSIRLEAEAPAASLKDVREIPVVNVEGLRAQLRSPAAGTVLRYAENSVIVLEVAGPDADRNLVESMSIRVVDAQGISLLVGESAPGAGLELAAPNFQISIMPEAGRHQAPIKVEAKVAGSRLRPRSDWTDAGQLGLALTGAQFTITSMDGGAPSTVAYKPVGVKLQGVPAGEKVEVRWELDGRSFASNEMTPTVEGLAPGLYRITAEVIRADGSRTSVGPTGLEVGSSLSLRAGDGSLRWESGDPPAATIEIVGDPRELSQIGRVQWEGASPDPSNPKVASCRFPVAAGSEATSLAPRTVRAVADFTNDTRRSVPLTAVVTPQPTPPKIGPVRVSVGGAKDRNRVGGALTHEAEVGGVWSSKRVVYSYEPTEVAASRGFKKVVEQDCPADLVVDDGADGVWSVTYQAIPYGGGTPVVGTGTFVKQRKLNWLPFLIWVGAAISLFAFLGWLNWLNGGMNWSVVVGSEADANNQTNESTLGVRPRLFGGGPRWAVWSKSAEIDLLDLREPSFFASPKFNWVKSAIDPVSKGAAAAGRIMIVWSRDNQPSIETTCSLRPRPVASRSMSRTIYAIPAPPAAIEEPPRSTSERGFEEDSFMSVEEAVVQPRASLYIAFERVTGTSASKFGVFAWAVLGLGFVVAVAHAWTNVL